MISFALEEDQQIIQETVRKFAAEAVRPKLRDWEKAKGVPADAMKKFHELGISLIDIPEKMGGAGAGAFTAALVHEELAFGDAGAAVALWAPHLAAAAIAELGSPSQAERLIARFNEPGTLGAIAWAEKGKVPLDGFATVAEKRGGGYVLNGAKAWVVNGDRAALSVVFAQVEPGKGWDGIGAFVVEAGARGIKETARLETLGLETAYLAEVRLEGVEVKEDNRLGGGERGFTESLRRFFARSILMAAARQVGLARASYEYALAYTQERQAFGKPVAHFQSIAFTLADMHMDVESARWLLWRAAAAFDAADMPLDLVPITRAGVHANEAAWRVADQAVQLLGGAGYVQDFPVEKWMRDTKALALLGPGDEHMQLAAAGLELGHSIERGWPSSAIQPVII